QAFRKTQVKIGRINTNKNIDRIFTPNVHQTITDGKQLFNIFENFNYSHDRQNIHWIIALKAFGQHLRPANPFKFHINTLLSKTTDELCTKRISRYLSHHDSDFKFPFLQVYSLRCVECQPYRILT